MSYVTSLLKNLPSPCTVFKILILPEHLPISSPVSSQLLWSLAHWNLAMFSTLEENHELYPLTKWTCFSPPFSWCHYKSIALPQLLKLIWSIEMWALDHLQIWYFPHNYLWAIGCLKLSLVGNSFINHCSWYDVCQNFNIYSSYHLRCVDWK